MKILVTFENQRIPVHSVDLLAMLWANGHQLYLYILNYDSSKGILYNGILSKYAIIVYDFSKLNEMNVWMYDLTVGDNDRGLHWREQKSPLLHLLENFSGKLICINYADQYEFNLFRISNYIIDKTHGFINNTLHRDIELYDSRVRNKLILVTSYISNSQSFKNIKVPFEKKSDRAFFTGSITGFSLTHPDELKCRIKVPMAIINANLPMIYRIYNYDQSLKNIYDHDVLPVFKSKILSMDSYLQLFSNSKYILSLRGMGCTVNRFFEGHAAASLVFSTKFDHLVQFIGQGEANKHYVEIDWSGSDVVERIKYYSENDKEARRIANNGRKLWEEYSMRDKDDLLPIKVRKNIIENIYQISGIQF